MEWKRTKDPAEWRHDPEVSKLYGAYVFWLMHYRTPAEKRKAEPFQKKLEEREFNGWGMALDLWPAAGRVYLDLAKEHGVEPEATDGDSELRRKLIRMAHVDPSLRPYLLPLLREP